MSPCVVLEPTESSLTFAGLQLNIEPLPNDQIQPDNTVDRFFTNEPFQDSFFTGNMTNDLEQGFSANSFDFLFMTDTAATTCLAE